MPYELSRRLAAGPLLCDGAMGTLLYARGVSADACFDVLNLNNPRVIQSIHADYIAAGADCIETNTFGANRFKLAAHGLDGQVRDINRRGAALARDVRESAGRDVFVLGSVGPLGRYLAPLGTVTPDEARTAFQEQADALLEGGVDGFILETFSDLLVAYLIPGRPTYRARTRPTVEEAIATIHKAGGVAVWAHPFWDLDRPYEALHTIDRFKAAGLDGVEVFYITHTEEQTLFLADACTERGMLQTGSADFHGPDNPRFNQFGAFELYGREPVLGPIAP